MNLFQYSAPDMFINHSMDENPSQAKFFMHTHAYAELYCFLRGKAIFHVEGTAYRLQPGDILLMRPAEAHYVQVDISEPYERICLNFDTGLLTPLDPENQLVQPFFERKAGKQNLFRPEKDACLEYLKRMVTSSQNQRLTILANLVLLMQQLCDMFQTGQQSINDPDTMEYRLIRYINKNLDRELTITDLCDKFFVSRTQLCDRFKQATGTTVGNYISVKRLLLARHLLLRGQKATEVATACGYEDYSAFYRAYMKYFGHSPKDEQKYGYAFTRETYVIE